MKPDQEKNWRLLEARAVAAEQKVKWYESKATPVTVADGLPPKTAPADKRIKQLLAERDAAYARGRADGFAEAIKTMESKRRAEETNKKWKERIERARDKWPDFDEAYQKVRGLVPPAVLEEIGTLPSGFHAGYFLRANVPLCKELSEMEPEQARQRFRIFAADLAFLEGR